MGSLKIVRQSDAGKKVAERAMTEEEMERYMYFKAMMTQLNVRQMFKWFVDNR